MSCVALRKIQSGVALPPQRATMIFAKITTPEMISNTASRASILEIVSSDTCSEIGTETVEPRATVGPPSILLRRLGFQNETWMRSPKSISSAFSKLAFTTIWFASNTGIAASFRIV